MVYSRREADDCPPESFFFFFTPPSLGNPPELAPAAPQGVGAVCVCLFEAAGKRGSIRVKGGGVSKGRVRFFGQLHFRGDKVTHALNKLAHKHQQRATEHRFHPAECCHRHRKTCFNSQKP